MKRQRIGLQMRFLRAVALATLAFAVLAGSLAYELGLRRAEQSARTSVLDLQAAVDKTAAVAVYARDTNLMREVAQGVGRNPLVRRVDIVDAQGHELLADARGPLTADSPLVQGRPLTSPFDKAERLGTLRVEIDPEQVGRSARREAWTLAALMASQSALIAFVIYLTGARIVSRPISRLARAMASMQPGTERLLAMPPSHGHDEIGALVRSANALLTANADTLWRERDLRHHIEAMEAQYRQIFDSSSAGIFVLTRDGRLVNGNPTVLKLIGGLGVGDLDDMRRLRGQDFIGRVFSRPDRVRALIDEAAAQGETVAADLELCTGDGDSRWVHCLVSVQEAVGPDGAAGEGGGFVEGVLYDITERKRQEHDVRRRAERDALTGAFNRAATEAALDQLLGAPPGPITVTLLYLDIDGFKQVNDMHGHACGDQVLQEAVRRIGLELRRSADFVGRVGGDEFVVVLQQGADDTGLSAAHLAANLVAHLREPFVLEGRGAIQIGVSIGIASTPRHGSRRRPLMHAADEAMYAVKRHGKNAYASAMALAG